MSLFLLCWICCFGFFVPSGVEAVRNLQIVTPLQALTIWDPEVKEEMAETGSSFRSRFLPRFRAGITAEADMRRKLSEQQREQQLLSADDASSSEWAGKAAAKHRRIRSMEEQVAEQAFDQTVAQYDQQISARNKQRPKKENPNTYQFVGVINNSPASSSKQQQEQQQEPITWYARKKPKHAKWSLRLVHVNREAIVKDLFQQGKVDIFAKYENTGNIDEKTNQPIIRTKYKVRQRSWKNLWNFSPKHYFSDSSGMYWRERRLRPGLYTDGNVVYEASYRYVDGRNGMHRLSNFQDFLKSKAVSTSTKEDIVRRLKHETPDVVLED